MLRVGHEHLAAAPLPKLAQPILQMIGDKTGEVASLAVLDGPESVFLARSVSRRIVSLAIGVGTRLPAYCSWTGRTVLAGRSDAEVERFLAGIRPMKFTVKTKSSHGQLLEEIRKARTNGFAISDEEYEIGLRSIAVPVRDASGSTVAALSLSVRADRMTPNQMTKELLPRSKWGGRCCRLCSSECARRDHISRENRDVKCTRIAGCGARAAHEGYSGLGFNFRGPFGEATGG